MLGTIEQRLRAVPWWTWLALFAGSPACCRLGFESGYVRRVAFDTVIYMLLALGLNIVVGWGGLLDLGYVAFFGVGAYSYAFLTSDKFDVHLPTLLVIPLVAAIGAIVGYLVGLPSRRLIGDYLAIVTLFFLLVFPTVTNNGDNIRGHNLTGGANGILNVDPLSSSAGRCPARRRGALQRVLLLRRARVLRRRLRRAAAPERLADGPRVALAARGRARRRADGHARRPGSS